MKKILLFILVTLFNLISLSQTASQYTFTTGTLASLFDMSSGTTQLVGASQDDTRSSATAIGFTFNLCGTNFTDYSVNSNGLLRFGTTQLATSNYGSGWPFASSSFIAPFGGDLVTRSTGKVHYKLFGTSPTRYLVIEWKDMEINWSSTTTDGTFQLVIYETSNKIEVIFGPMKSGGAGTGGGGNTVRCGISNASTANNYLSVNLNTNAYSSSTVQSYTLPGGGTTLTNLNSTADGSRRIYTFTPPCNAVTAAGTVSGNQTVCSGGDPVAFTSSADASGGSNGFITYQWESSTTSSSSGYTDISGATSTTYNPPSGITSTTYYRRKAKRCSSWEQTTSVITVTVVPDATAPTATRSPVDASVCVGQTLTLTSPTYGAQAGQSCGFEYRFSTDNSSTWSSWSGTAPSFAAVTGTNVIQIRTVGGCSSGCDASPSTSYSWTVVADPTITNASSTYNFTVGQQAQLVSSSTGGTGTLSYIWRYSSDGTNFFDVVNGTPTGSTYSYDANLATNNTLSINGLSVGTYQYRFRQSNSTLGCANSGSIITLTISPVNDLCSNATTLNCATSNLGGTTVGAVVETPPASVLTSSYGVWYKFTGDGGQTTISSNAVFDHEMTILTGSSCGSFTQVATIDNELANITETYTFTTTNNQQYYVWIAHYSSGNTTTGSFTISRSCVPPCTTATNPGTLTVSANSGTVNDVFTYTTTGNEGSITKLEYSYDDFSTIAGTFTNPVNPFNFILNVYQTQVWVRTTSVNGGCPEGVSNKVLVTLQLAPPYVYGTDDGDYISNVTLNTINNNSTTDPILGDSYQDFTSISTSLVKGSTYTISVSSPITFNSTASGYAAWIDFNNNGMFEVSENIMQKAASPTQSQSFTVPNDAVTGIVKMRVLSMWNGTPTTDPYYSTGYNYGEIEEYRIDIQVPLPVELLYFEGTRYPTFNNLKWATASENNSSHFNIERSVDGEDWMVVGKRQASGNSQTKLNYYYIDYYNQDNTVYYRLNQYDIDGKSKIYGPIVIQGLYSSKKIVKYINLAGQEVNETYKGVVLEVYEDGTMRKTIR